MDDLLELLSSLKTKCEDKREKTAPPDGGLYCPIVWDEAYCWPYVPAGTLHKVSCPSYIHNFNMSAFATKYCTQDGVWWRNDENVSWTNYSMCIKGSEPDIDFSLKQHVLTIKLISKIGYIVSLSTLLIAVLILALVRRLRCPRNNLHIQLFISFILRALISLLKDALFVAGVGLRSNMMLKYGSVVFLESEHNVDCKVFTSFWHYFLTANYCWILMEGLYLHRLVFQAFFTDTSSILQYIVMGWGLPLPFIIIWAIVRVTLEDTFCWTTHENQGYFWIIRGPITLSIVVNFFFFLDITRVLYLKVFSHTSEARRYRYRKWFKSTLVLVPLFGVHYALLLGMSLAAGVSRIVEIVWLYADQFFSSFQGFFVALLYCFCNGEVKQEIRKTWQRWQLRKENPGRPHQSIFTQSLTLLSRGRSSIQSLHSCAERKDIYRPGTPVSKHRYRGDKEGDVMNCVVVSSHIPEQLFNLSPGLSMEGNDYPTLELRHIQASNQTWREEETVNESEDQHLRNERFNSKSEEFELETIGACEVSGNGKINFNLTGDFGRQTLEDKDINQPRNTEMEDKGQNRILKDLETKK